MLPKFTRGLVPAVLFVFLAVVMAACGPQTASLSASLTEFEFDPPTWEVPAGAEVELTLTNDGSVTHDWVLMPADYEPSPPAGPQTEAQALQALDDLEAGETGTFTFMAPDEPGEYPVICTEPGHLEAGMQGRLIVR